MNEDRKKLIADYKKGQRALKTRERLDAAVPIFGLTMLGFWAIAVVVTIGCAAYLLWVNGLGVVAIVLTVLVVSVLVWNFLDWKNKKDLEAERQRKLRANWRD